MAEPGGTAHLFGGGQQPVAGNPMPLSASVLDGTTATTSDLFGSSGGGDDFTASLFGNPQAHDSQSQPAVGTAALFGGPAGASPFDQPSFMAPSGAGPPPSQSQPMPPAEGPAAHSSIEGTGGNNSTPQSSQFFDSIIVCHRTIPTR